MRKSFKYKAITNSKTNSRATALLNSCQYLYNLAITERRFEYQNYKNHHSLKYPANRRKRLSAFDQSNQLPDLKEIHPEFKSIPSQAAQDIIDRVGKAYQRFYNLISKGQKCGLPRYKAKDRYKSFTLKKSGWKLEGRYLRVTGVGVFKLRLSRPILGEIKTITISRSCGEWYVSFSCDNVPEVIPIGPAKQAVGVDMGLTSFYTDTEGNKVSNPRYLKKSADSLAVAQRALAKKKRGSNNRKKCKAQLSKKHKKVSNSRRDFHYKVAKRLVANFYTIVLEKLNIKGMVSQDKFNKSIHDVSWGEFFAILSAKAEEAGRRVIAVNPKNTSQDCCICGCIVKKDITIRLHECACGAKMCRDLNAAYNILSRAGFNLLEYLPDGLRELYKRFGRSRSEGIALGDTGRRILVLPGTLGV